MLRICKRHIIRAAVAAPRRALAALVIGLTLAAGLGGTASAQAGAVIISTKSVSGPTGFSGICQKYAWACATGGPSQMSTSAALDLAHRINRQVNRQVRQVSDQRQYRRADHWALPTRRGGDCEDFALLKKRELLAAGVPGDRLLIATALIRRRQAHAVLILRTDRGDMVLDNLTNRIKPWRDTGYGFIRMQDPEAPHRWRMILAGGMFDRRGAGA